ncbi:unnamed protein product, partial [Discosporangium mesarthrocarpum]
MEGSTRPTRKCLVFAIHKAVLDVVESALLRPWLPSVRYARLDGSTPTRDRQRVVDCFNSDPFVALLLLTTSVGGLGLNLSTASMVIFLEHNWNPMVDLQAMDRAHRLGQRKTVNVYRLVAADSIEQRVLHLQGHKLEVVATVVSEENSTAFARGTDEVLTVLETAAVSTGSSNGSCTSGNPEPARDDRGETMGTWQGELWSEEDYDYLDAEVLAASVA